MPILGREIDLYPDDLLDRAELSEEHPWWVLYTASHCEKDLMRRLVAMKIAFYGPTILKRHKSPTGRIREAYLPLFSGYVFLYGNEEERYQALTTNRVSRTITVANGHQLTTDLRRISQLIAVGEPLTPESRLESGQRVRVKSGMFRGHEGYILKRHGETRLAVAVTFLQQGASVLLDDCELEPLR